MESKQAASEWSQSSGSGDSQSQDPNLCTPTNRQLRHKRLESLSTPLLGGRSPLLKIPASPTMERLGYGTGVGVYLMERSPRASGEIRSPWAIKKVSDMKSDRGNRSSYESRLEHEAKILRELSHPNIIGYRGYMKPSPLNERGFLAMEKAPTSLADLIETRLEEASGESDPFPAAKIARVAEDIAKALVYLHDEKKLLHGDLKSANVLVFGDFDIIKLCDFGVCRKIKEDGTIEGDYVGTEVWTPMEVIRAQRELPHDPITHKADIFAYGMVIYEMISLKTPHLATADLPCTEGGTELDASFDEDAFEENLALLVGTRPFLPDVEFDESYNNILALFFCCTEETPMKRPDAKDVLQVFTEIPKLQLPTEDDEDEKKDDDDVPSS